MARALLPQLEKSGKVTRGWLGVAVQDLSVDLAKALHVPVTQGAVVADVNADTPAAAAGLKPDDVITAVDGRTVESAGALTRNIALKAPGTTTKLTVYRDGKQLETPVKLGTRPDLEGYAEEKPGSKEAERQQRLGLSFQDMDPNLAQGRGLPTAGALITDVVPGSAAERAGLAPGAVVIEASGKPVRSAADLRRTLINAKPGAGILLRVQTGGGRGLRVLTIPE
jgi:serine protease Do